MIFYLYTSLLSAVWGLAMMTPLWRQYRYIRENKMLLFACFFYRLWCYIRLSILSFVPLSLSFFSLVVVKQVTGHFPLLWRDTWLEWPMTCTSGSPFSLAQGVYVLCFPWPLWLTTEPNSTIPSHSAFTLRYKERTLAYQHRAYPISVI